MIAWCGTPAQLLLTLGALRLDLMDPANGFAIEQVDIGYPTPRDDTSAIPDRDGEWDDTAWFGARAVTINGTVVPSAYGSRSTVLDALAPFLAASARPTLTYQIDGDVAARYLRVRATALSAPHSNPAVTAFQLAWRAPDPIAYGTAMNQVSLIPVSSLAGRTYTTPQGAAITATSGFTPPRYYPAISGALQVDAVNLGALNSAPLIQISGVCSNPAMWNDTVGAVFVVGTDAQPLNLRAGEVLTIDTRARTVYLGGDPNNTRYNFVDFSQSVWWALIPGSNQLRFVPETAGTGATAVVTWQDAYL
ncbi:MAG TPA: hypothetical protein VGH66_02770 [Acidimicrobiales bacterium]|jgi:hypothetical protein